jgi:hypothetical protein
MNIKVVSKLLLGHLIIQITLDTYSLMYLNNFKMRKYLRLMIILRIKNCFRTTFYFFTNFHNNLLSHLSKLLPHLTNYYLINH